MPATRTDAHAAVAAELAGLDDDAVAAVVAGASATGTGIGGTVGTLEVGGVRVFVKSIPLTDLERRPDNLHSTANLFALPTWCQYGVSSPGFGAWRELAAHLMTTSWVLSGQCAGFPLLHHWRVIPRAASSMLTADDRRDVERQVAAWGGSEAIRDRFTARKLATASIAIFLEWFPANLRRWLAEQLAAGGPAAQVAVDGVERELLEITAAMNARGLLHFDAHFENILTDGHHLYVSDFGQALCDRFALAPAETEFFERHRDFDRAYVVTRLVNAVRDAPAGAAIVARHAPTAAVMNEFFRRLLTEAKTTPYPAAELAAALAARRA